MKIKIYKASNWFDNCVLWALLLLPHMKTDYMNEVILLDRIFNVGRVVSGVLIFVILLSCRSVKLKATSALLIMLQVQLFVSTLVNGLPVYDVFLRMVSVTCIVLLINFMSERDPLKALKTVFVCMAIFILLNLTTVIFFPEGLYHMGAERKYYFLGHVNVCILYILPAIVTALLLWNVQYGHGIKVLCFGVIMTGMITEIIVWSATSLVALVLFILLLGGRKIWENIKGVNVFTSFLSAVGVTLLIVFFKIQYWFDILIEDILKRSMDFTRRLRMWDLTIRYIREKPWMGYGVENIAIRAFKIGGPNAHNFFWELLYQGGMIALLIWLLAVFFLAIELGKCRSTFAFTVISAAIMCAMVMGITESALGLTIFYLLLSLGANCSYYADFNQKKMIQE